jgi:hypothetical protein
MPILTISRFRCLLLVALACSLAGCDYSTEVKKSVKRVLGQDFGSYHFFATPAGNFGAGTMYLKSAGNRKPSEIGDEALIAIPDTYFANDVPAAEREALLRRLFPDGKIGKFNVNEKLAKGLALEVAVPGISGVINASGTVDLKKGVTVELQAGETAVRRLNWTELARARNDKKIAADIVEHLDARDVMIAMNDVVIRGYTAVVTIDATANAGLKAELDKAAQAAPVTLPSGKTSFSSGQNGTYRIEVTDPVVVAILFKEIPVGVLAAADTDKWPVAPVRSGVASRLQELVARRRAAIK